jgi:Lsr2
MEEQVAQRTIIQLTDDLDGAVADRTVNFGYEGVTYELDLSTRNADKFAKTLEPYIAAGRRVGGRKSSGRSAATKANQEEMRAIRQWAKDSGYNVSDRGRISAEVQAAYHAAP